MAVRLARAALVWLPLAGLLACRPCGGVSLHPAHGKAHKKRKADAALRPSGRALRQPISKIFYVNMRESVERREAIEAALDKNADGVPFERFEAVTGLQALTESPYIDIVRAQNVSAAFLTPNMTLRMPGAMGCYMSHRFLLEHISKLPGDKDAIYLIVEDDVNITKGWKKRLASLWPSIPANWDLIKLGYVGTEWPCDEVSKGVYVAKLAAGKSRSLGCMRHYTGTQTYAVTPRSAARIVQLLKETDVRDIDTILCTGRQCARRVPGKRTPNVYTLFDMKPYFTADPQKNSTIGYVHWLKSSAECYATLASLKPGEIDCAMLRRPKRVNESGPIDTPPTSPPEYVHNGLPYVDKVLRDLFPAY